MTKFSSFVATLNKNKVFRFTSSVRLAVILMLSLGLCVAVGTIIESNYNSEYAKISIYNTNWFLVFLGLLWLNIFSATVSRWPFKAHHTGFVITHIGLLTLLIGSVVTGFMGTDGQLRITEGQSNNQIVLSRLMLSYQLEGSPSPQSISFEKTLTEKTGSSLNFLNDSFGHLFTVTKLLPFAKIEKDYLNKGLDSNQVGLSFLLRSPFFQVGEWLHSKDNPEMKMGPATLRLVVDNENSPRPPQTLKAIKPKTAVVPSLGGDLLIIKEATGKKVLKEISIAELKKKAISINQVLIELKNIYHHAIVSSNKIVEGSTNESTNPALELAIKKDKISKREITYAKFPDFSINSDGDFGLAFEYRVSEKSEAPSNLQMNETPGQLSAQGSRQGNVVEFHITKSNPEVASVELYKNNSFVAKETLKVGESFETPWMGMRISLASMAWGSEPILRAEAEQPEKGGQLPPSAISIRPVNSKDELWLIEGDVKTIQAAGKNVTVYFGRETLDLPFALQLLKFTKTDYPGTETPLSYESDVKIVETGELQKISMNEPLKNMGFTVYQSSFVMNPEGPPDSIFSVNRDPGRPIKYAGSLILGIGIITFTLMRSRFWKNRKKIS